VSHARLGWGKSEASRKVDDRHNTLADRLMRPRTNLGACGNGVAGVQPRISRTHMTATR
jgi:hypothetical protein